MLRSGGWGRSCSVGSSWAPRPEMQSESFKGRANMALGWSVAPVLEVFLQHESLLVDGVTEFH